MQFRPFLRIKTFYHPIAAKMVATDLASTKSEETKANAKETKASVCGVVTYLQKPIVIGGILVLSAAVGIALVRGKRH